MTSAHKTGSHAAVRHEVADLFTPRPGVYWVDLLVHAGLGWGAFALTVAGGGWAALLSGVVATLALYRAVIFTHELVHLRRDHVPGFGVAWDALCGVPLMAPSFLYDGVHQAHHFRQHYGTPGDGEYLPFGQPPRWTILVYLLSHVLIPLLALLRFGVIAPLSRVWPSIRRFVLRRMSSLSIDPRFERNVPSRVPRAWIIQEAACTTVVWFALAAMGAGWLPWRLLAVWYAVMTAILVLNGIRTLAAHRYANRGEVMSRDAQLLDSVNIAGRSPLTPALAPVGLRYHALHHLFPTMPYHNLGAAHRRLMRRLPPEAPYRATVETGFTAVLADLWRRAGQGGAGAA